MTTFKSAISGKEYPTSKRVRGSSVLPTIMDEIRKDHPNFNDESSFAWEELQGYRDRYLNDVLLKATEEEKIESEEITYGQRMADAVARFGGSWKFLFVFFAFIVGWMALNVYLLVAHPFDPYPFILLNLILSCLAAVQAPIIMMSQNRQEERDRQRAREDLKVDLKAEIEIRLLHQKVDDLARHITGTNQN